MCVCVRECVREGVRACDVRDHLESMWSLSQGGLALSSICEWLRVGAWIMQAKASSRVVSRVVRCWGWLVAKVVRG